MEKSMNKTSIRVIYVYEGVFFYVSLRENIHFLFFFVIIFEYDFMLIKYNITFKN